MKKLIIGLMLLFSITSVNASETINIGQAVNMPLMNDANSTNLEVNASISSPVSFRAIPQAGKAWWIGNIAGYLEGATAFDAEKFGNLPALTNGLIVKINGVQIALWKTNLDIAMMINVLDAPIALAKNDRAMIGSWNLKDAFGKPILVGASGIEVIVQDDLSSLVRFNIHVQGLEH